MAFAELFDTFANNLLPILLIAAAGYALGKTLTIDSRTIGRVVFYIFSPLLVFSLMAASRLSLKQALLTVVYTAAVIFTLGAIAFLLGRLFQLRRSHLLAVILTVAFGNTGNYGLPLVKFAFGDEALAIASIFYVATTLLFNTFGVVIASLGHLDLKSAILGIFKLPVLYAVMTALFFRGTGVQIPLPLSRAIEIAANGAIPAMLVLLGLELARIEWSDSLRTAGLGVAMKLLIAPVVGLLLAGVFGLEGHTRQASVIESAMPAAVANTVLAAEYKLESSLVTAIVFFGTILSPLTLTPLIVFLAR